MRLRSLLIVGAVLAACFLPALSPDAQFVFRDTGRMHEPNKRFVATELSHGRLPEWNPLSGMGTPLVAGSIDAVLHPFNLLLVALPAGAGLKAWILASFLLAALGGRAWGRALGLGEEASTLGGLAFALSGPLLSSTDNVTYLTTYAALPGFFAALHRFLVDGGPGRLALVLAASFLTAAGGDPQAWGIALLATVPYALALSVPGDRRVALRRGLLVILAGLAGAAPVIFPVLAWIGETHRAVAPDAVELARWNLGARRLPELLLPALFRSDPTVSTSPVFQRFCGSAYDDLPWFLSIYVGAGAIALATAGALLRRWARWLLAAGALLAWAALGPNAGFGQLALHLPLLRGFRYWEKLTVWPALAVALAAAAGLDALLERRADLAPRFARAAAIAAGVALGLAALAAVPGAVAGAVGGGAEGAMLGENLLAAALHAGAILGVLAVVALAVGRGRLGAPAGWALAGVVLVDLFGANVGAYVLGRMPATGTPPLASGLSGPRRIVTAFAMRQDRWPALNGLENTWEWGRRTLEPSWNVGVGVANFRDYQGLGERRHHRVNVALGGSGQWAAAGLWGFAGVVVPGAPELAAKVGAKGPPSILASDPELPAWVVEIPHRDRAYLARGVVEADAERALGFALAGGAPDSTVIEAPVPSGASEGAGRVQVLDDRAGRIALTVDAERPGLLVLNDAFARGWRADVDGRPAPIHRVNYLAQGIWVDRGRHAVGFEYRTPGLRLGLGVALAAAAALAAWGVAARVARRRARA